MAVIACQGNLGRVAARDSAGAKRAINDFPKLFDCINVYLIIVWPA